MSGFNIVALNGIELALRLQKNLSDNDARNYLYNALKSREVWDAISRHVDTQIQYVQTGGDELTFGKTKIRPP